jgi:hypothetical protein
MSTINEESLFSSVPEENKKSNDPNDPTEKNAKFEVVCFNFFQIIV